MSVAVGRERGVGNQVPYMGEGRGAMSPEFMLEGCGRFPGPMSGVGGLGTVISNGSWLMVT